MRAQSRQQTNQASMGPWGTEPAQTLQTRGHHKQDTGMHRLSTLEESVSRIKTRNRNTSWPIKRQQTWQHHPCARESQLASLFRYVCGQENRFGPFVIAIILRRQNEESPDTCGSAECSEIGHLYIMVCLAAAGGRSYSTPLA